MKSCEWELTEEDIKKIEEKGIYSMFSDSMIMGYGVYGAHIADKDGKKVLRFSMGDSCD